MPSFPLGEARLLTKRAKAPGDLLCLDTESGQSQWSWLPSDGTPFSILGHDGMTVWLSVSSKNFSAPSKLIGLDLDTGTVSAVIEVPMLHSPSGFIDNEGLLHAYNGSSYLCFDLSAGGTRLFAHRLSDRRLRDGMCHLLNRDGVLLAMADSGKRVFAIRVGESVEATLIFQAKKMIVGLQPVSNGLLILENDNTLAASH